MSENDNIINSYATTDLASIYKQISIEEDMLFDVSEEHNFLVECIEKAFNKNFRLIETNILLSDTNLINLQFVNLIKFCLGLPKPYNKTHNLFIEYCDYFDLPYNKCFLLLHEKLQTRIKKGCIEMVGEKQYNKIDNINNPDRVFTLFDLIKPK